jgi:hypothetical protein
LSNLTVRIWNSERVIFIFDNNEIVTNTNNIIKISKIVYKELFSREISNTLKYSKKEISKYTKRTNIVNNT